MGDKVFISQVVFLGTLECTNVHMYTSTKVDKYTSKQENKNTSTQVHKYTTELMKNCIFLKNYRSWCDSSWGNSSWGNSS